MSLALFSVLLSVLITPSVDAQRYGVVIPEVHPALSWQKCTVPGGCTAQAGKVVLDANWRWYHSGSWDCWDGTDWQLVTRPSGSQSPNVGSRVYLMADDNSYATFKPLAQEIAFDVDMSTLECGIAADIHFAEMAADGGIAESPAGWNNAGAKYGTGYCGAQCPRDVRFIQGHLNYQGNGPTPPPFGLGPYGSCCAEMDLWQANKFSTATTAHPCLIQGRFKCEEDDCGASAPSGNSANGVCDPDGCDFNPFRMGNPSFYGLGNTVDTTKKLTVVTQFITDNGTPSGSLIEIRRNGVPIANSYVNVPGVDPFFNSITSQYCDQQKAAFGDMPSFQTKGGWDALGGGFKTRDGTGIEHLR
ncbi:glycoside hydrolase family 7 protein [Tulasnella calospora MUT 4182]|uniref:Glucanase n=1 Tax=Tulasnella calospora MUT 4182 TaxID=1051891 RepID=A0A0C3LMP6_9AGAM|nr:glycoside hydrolase family 7 protein [Tulasnella calospora MUT 4182]